MSSKLKQIKEYRKYIFLMDIKEFLPDILLYIYFQANTLGKLSILSYFFMQFYKVHSSDYILKIH